MRTVTLLLHRKVDILAYLLIIIGLSYNLIPYIMFIYTGKLLYIIFRIPFLGIVIMAGGILILLKNKEMKK